MELLATLGDVVIDGDRTRLAQVIDNLVSNAIKFTPLSGRVEVLVARDGDTATITVADSGMGMSPAEQEHLFERFYRTGGATRAAIPGTGLGLTIVEAIVTSHGGTIAVESREGHGTTFRIALPIVVHELTAA